MNWRGLLVRLSPAKQRAMLDASRDGYVDAVRRLLAEGVSPDVTGHFGLTALMLAVANGHTCVVSELVAAGADPNKEDVGGDTPLALAIRQGDTAILEVLQKAPGC